MYTAIRGLGAITGRAPGPEVKAMLAARQRSRPARLRRIHTTLSLIHASAPSLVDPGRLVHAVMPRPVGWAWPPVPE
jgi:hypothetical protein